MSKYKTGDKVVMEITKGKTLLGTDYYLFNDGFGIRQGLVELNAEPLTTYTEQARAEGHSEAWELARKIASTAGGLSSSELVEIFNAFLPRDILSNNTYPEAAAKLVEWEKAKEEIKVGDIFQDNDGNNAIVTSIKGNTVYYMWDDGDTRSGFAEDVKKHFTKTGRHIDIDGFLKQIGGTE